MCGIFGIVSNENKVSLDELNISSELLKNRGPDDSGYWQEENVSFGHRRLSILDLSSNGHQPMFFDDRFVIVYNGEIYNFIEIKRNLEEYSDKWNSNSDTEVILAAYAKWGIDCVNKFRGMFSFAIWDKKEKILFAARDRIGIKPFYYHFSNDCFIFASRPKAIFPLKKELSKNIDNQALRLYFESGYVPAPLSIYENIQKLPPAHILILKNNKLEIKRYWDFRHIEPNHSWERRKEEDLLDEMDELISRSVTSRMISDVPLGAFLSGGIDSSLVVAIMAKKSSIPIKTFTIGFNERNYDESIHAKLVSKHLGTEHIEEILDVNDLLKLIPRFNGEFDEPFFDHSAFPVMAVSRMAKSHVSVTLSGDGGDELFGGYHYYNILKKLNYIYRSPILMRKILASNIGVFSNHKLKLLSGALKQPDIVSSFAFSRSIAKDFGTLIEKLVLNKTESISDLFIKASTTFPNNLDPSDIGMRLDTFYTLPDDYLQKIDVASMSYSLEARVPLLDHNLVEWSCKLPNKWKIRNGINKYLLRKLAYRYVPQNILDRPKQGFGVPVDNWLRNELKKWAEDLLYDKSLYSNSPLKQTSVIKLWELHKSKKREVHPLLWAVLVFLNFTSKK